MKILKIDLVLKLQGSKFELKFKQDIKTKYALLTGDSATLKTGFLVMLGVNDAYTDGGYLLDYNKNKLHIINDVFEFLNYDTLNTFDLCCCDENVTNILNSILSNSKHPDHTRYCAALESCTSKILFIGRDIPSLQIAYYSIFEIQRHNDINIIERSYKDYNYFQYKSRILVEDSRTGFEYYQHYFSNVFSSNGKNNFSNLCAEDDTIVADGSAFGNLLKILQTKVFNIYLPESFEYDLATHWLPAHRDVLNYQSDMPDNCPSVEKYFEDVVLPNLCEENHLPRYSKSRKLHTVLLNVKIHDDTKALFEKFFKEHGLTFEEAYKQYSTLYESDSISNIVTHLKEDGLI